MRITAIGNANIDITLFLEEMPGYDEDILADDIIFGPGGSASNFAAASSHLGAESFLIACVGSDLFGEVFLKEMKAHNVSTEWIKRIREERTGTVVVIQERGRQRRMITMRGANSRLGTLDFSEFLPLLRSSDVVHISSVYEDVVSGVLKVYRGISWDPGIKIVRKMGRRIIDYLSGVKRLFMNIKEAELVFKGEDEVKKISKEVDVILKMGSRGARAYVEGRVYEQKAVEAKAVDTTGAGDIFDAACTIALLRGMDVNSSLKLANAAASIKIAIKGTQSGLPSWKEALDVTAKFYGGI
jgi:ribokinase